MKADTIAQQQRRESLFNHQVTRLAATRLKNALDDQSPISIATIGSVSRKTVPEVAVKRHTINIFILYGLKSRVNAFQKSKKGIFRFK